MAGMGFQSSGPRPSCHLFELEADTISMVTGQGATQPVSMRNARQPE